MKGIQFIATLTLLMVLTSCNSTTNSSCFYNGNNNFSKPIGELKEIGFNFDEFDFEYEMYDLIDIHDIKVKKIDEVGNVFYDDLDITNVSSIDNITSTTGKKTFNIEYGSLKEKVNIYVYYPMDKYNEPYRSQFHYSKEKGWINDPNGLVYNAYTGEYHMYYQDGPRFGSDPVNFWSSRSWGHAVSKDLVHWYEVGLAIYPQADGFGDIWSGGAVVDIHNTSGLFDNSIRKEERLVAIYTVTRPVSQMCMAYSYDGGYTWIKYENNPVINNINYVIGEGFRDCKVYWLEDEENINGGVWLMITAGECGMKIFTSNNLIDWELNSSVRDENYNIVGGECPMLLRMEVDDNPSNIKYVLSDGGKYYYIGRLEKNNSGKYIYTIESNKQVFNAGSKNYATQDWYLLNSNRVIFTSWIQDYYMESNSKDTPGRPWEGLMGIPVEAKLKTNLRGQIQLYTNPIHEFDVLRRDVLFEIDDLEVNSNSSNILNLVEDSTFEINTSFTVDKNYLESAKISFDIREGNGEYISIVYTPNDNIISVDQRNTKIANYMDSTTIIENVNHEINLRIIVDVGAIEVFVNDGEKSISTIYFIDDNNLKMSLNVLGCKIHINDMKVYHLASILHKNI